MSNHLAQSMRNVIKQKVYSALCDTDRVDVFNKSMYEGKRVMYDNEKGCVVTVEDPKYA